MYTDNDNEIKTNSDTASQQEVNLLSQLSQFVQGVFSSNPSQQLASTRQIRIMLGLTTEPPIKEVMDCGVLPQLLQFIQKSNHNELLYESIWVLINLASGLDDTTSLIRASTHTILINSLQHPLYEIKLMSIWAIGNIIGTDAAVRDLLLDYQILQNISVICQLPFDEQYSTNFNNNLNVANNPSLIFISLLATTSWVLSNVCRPAEFADIKHMQLIVQCFQHLWRQALLYQHHTDINIRKQVYEIFSHIAWAFSYLTDHQKYEQQLIRAINEYGFIEQFVSLMDHKQSSVRHSMLRVIGNFLVFSDVDELTDKCLSLGILDKYYTVLTTTKYCREKREICWAISNITAGTLKQQKLFISSSIHPILINYLENESWDMSKEALWAISNATTPRDISLIEPLVRQGVIRALCAFLRKWVTEKYPSKVMLVALTCMDNILYRGWHEQFERFGAVECLTQLQCDSSSDKVYGRAAQIMGEYYEKQLLEVTSNKLKFNSSKGQIRALEFICGAYNIDFSLLYSSWIDEINLVQIIFGPSESSLFQFDLLIKGYVRNYNKGPYLPCDVLKLIVLWYNDCQQPHLIRRCGNILKYMIGNDMFTNNHMECIWNAIQTAAGKNDETERDAIYNVIDNVKSNFTEKQKEFMLSKLEDVKFASKILSKYHTKLKQLLLETQGNFGVIDMDMEAQNLPFNLTFAPTDDNDFGAWRF